MYWRMQLEKKINYSKEFLKVEIKKMRIKIKIQNKFYIWLKGEIKKK